MSTTAAQLEQELRLMIKTLTNLGYSEWTSISDNEVRTGSPRVYCSFLRYLLEDCHPRVLQMLLSAKTADGDMTQQQRINQSNRIRSCSEGRQHPVAALQQRPGNSATRSTTTTRPSSINKLVASTVGTHPPPSSGVKPCGAISNPSFIVEQDDTRFVQRLLQYVLPEHFSVTSPMTPHQFFRASGGFVLQKAKLVRNVAALFSRREAQLEKEEQNKMDALEHTKLLMERSRKHNIMKQCGVGDDLAYLQFEPKPLIDDKNATNYPRGGGIHSCLTSRQRVELAEKQKKAAIARRLDEIRERERRLNEIANRSRKVFVEDDVENRRQLLAASAAQSSPMTLLASPPRAGSQELVVINKQLEEMKRREEEQLHQQQQNTRRRSSTTSSLLLDQAVERRPSGNEELVEEGVMLMSPASKRR